MIVLKTRGVNQSQRQILQQVKTLLGTKVCINENHQILTFLCNQSLS